MKIIYKKCDLLECEEKFILHGCNAQGVMGSGVAKAIRSKYPDAYHAYLAGLQQLGIVTYSEQLDGKTVFNAITQKYYGRQVGKRYVDYQALEDALQRINWWMSINHNLEAIAMPKIGAGLGGGDWKVIEEIIEKESMNFQPVVYEL